MENKKTEKEVIEKLTEKICFGGSLDEIIYDLVGAIEDLHDITEANEPYATRTLRDMKTACSVLLDLVCLYWEE